MDKHLVDFESLDTKFNKPKVYKLSDVKHLITKVAFDIVRFRENEDTEQLWKIEDTVDGPVIVAMYQSTPASEKISNASTNNWKVVVSGQNLNIFYKDENIKKIAALSEDDAFSMSRWIPKSLNSNASFRSAFLNEIPEVSRDFLFTKYPELRG